LRVDRGDPQAQGRVRSRARGERVRLCRLDRAARRQQLAVAGLQQQLGLRESELGEVRRLAESGRRLRGEREAEKRLSQMIEELAHERCNSIQQRLTTD